MASNMDIVFDEPSIGRLEVLSWNHGVSQQPAGTRSSGGGSAAHESLRFTKYVDAKSNELMQACWNGRQFHSAVLTVYRAGDDDRLVVFLKVTMTHVVISNYSVSGGPGDLPVENISLDYGIVAYEYFHHKAIDSETHDTPK